MTRLSIAIRIAALLLTAAVPARAQDKPHAGHQPQKPAPAAQPAHEHGADTADAADDLPPFIPQLTDDDRKAAFPDVRGHTAHGNSVNYFVLFDQLEWQFARGANGLNVDSRGWVGRDRDRLWFRAEGDGRGGAVDEAQAHVFYGRQVSRWWDLVAGIRQDVRPGDPQTWAAIGVEGLAPYWFEIEATAYLGAGARTEARLKVEYDLLITNHLILQPLVELDVAGKSDPERGIGAGVSSTDAGVRLRYEWRREIAPHVGVTWSRKWGKTAEFAEAEGEGRGGVRLVTGLRLWF
jgi:copper resistance protein B